MKPLSTFNNRTSNYKKAKEAEPEPISEYNVRATKTRRTVEDIVEQREFNKLFNYK